MKGFNHADQKRALFYLLLALSAILSSAANDKPLQTATCENSDSTFECKPNYQQNENLMANCQLFLAPSTLEGAGLGIFTGRAMKPDDVFDNTTRDVAIPLINMPYHQDSAPADDPAWSPLGSYTWDMDAMGMRREGADGDALCPGIYAATNSFAPLFNVESSMPEFDSGGLHRAFHPGAGAITLYFGAKIWASRFIPKGGELFLNYGEEWFTSRRGEFKSTTVLLPSDIEKAANITQMFGELTTLSSPPRQALWDLIRAMPWKIQALPKTLQEVEAVIEHQDLGVLYQANATRSLEDLKQSGTCLSHIVSRMSTISEAGRGAFATRAFAANDIITTSPLVHIADNGILLLSDGHHTLYQLLVNYCFGHVQSTLVLCPYSAGVGLINHYKDSRKQEKNTKPNVRIRWSQDGRLGHNASIVQNYRLENLVLESKVKLAFDFVATREINEGEELLMDYGDAWQQAWDHHLATWQPFDKSQSTERYIASWHWNKWFGNAPLRTKTEQFFDPYPTNLELHCHPFLKDQAWKQKIANREKSLWEPHERGVHCNIVNRYPALDGELVYDVKFLFRKPNDVNKGVPRRAFRFVDKFHTTDIHLPNSFRHPIQIPDDMFPSQWKNLAAGPLERQTPSGRN